MDFIPPPEVASAAEEGLKLREQFRRGGTAVGIARARQLISGEALSPTDIRRMYAYFARHEVDKKGKNFYKSDRPSNGYIAWQLWGGEPGRVWATAMRAALHTTTDTRIHTRTYDT